MKLIDVAARNAKEDAAIQTKIRAFLKKSKSKSMCNIGELTFPIEGAIRYIELENDGVLGNDYLADFVRKSPNAVLQSVKEYGGAYDWSSDTYSRPVSVVSYTY